MKLKTLVAIITVIATTPIIAFAINQIKYFDDFNRVDNNSSGWTEQEIAATDIQISNNTLKMSSGATDALAASKARPSGLNNTGFIISGKVMFASAAQGQANIEAAMDQTTRNECFGRCIEIVSSNGNILMVDNGAVIASNTNFGAMSAGIFYSFEWDINPDNSGKFFFWITSAGKPATPILTIPRFTSAYTGGNAVGVDGQLITSWDDLYFGQNPPPTVMIKGGKTKMRGHIVITSK